MASESLGDAVDQFLALFGWLSWLGVAAILLLSILLGYLVWQRKYADKKINLSLPQAISVPKQLVLSPQAFSGIWKGFVRAIPWRLRPDAFRTPLFIMIGDAGNGKTGIIDRYADWKGQDYLFRPSVTQNPLLQIYLGAKALVLEFGASVIYDTHPAAFHALKKLWRKIPPKPQAIMAIDAGTLLEPQSDHLRQSGQALFGKLKIFSKLEGKPLPLVVALTHMDRMPGFIEFCVFLQESGIPLQIDFPKRDGIKGLQTCLDDYRRHLPRALTTRPAQEYLKIVEFLYEAPRLFGVLVDFLRVSGLEQGVGSPPIIRICLLSEHVISFGCRPFAPQDAAVKPKLIYLNGHAKAAMAILVFGMTYFAGSYNYEQSLIADVRQKMDTVAQTPVEYYPEKISPLFLDFSSDLNRDPLLSITPNFFGKIIEYHEYLLIQEIRKYYLIPMLKKLQFREDAPFKTIRFLGFLYATRHNEVGKILARHLDKNPLELSKFQVLINDYIKHNSHTEELDLPLNEIVYAKSQPIMEDHASWLAMFRYFQQLVKKPYAQETEFQQIQQQLAPFLSVIDKLDFYTDQKEIRQWLILHTGLRLNDEDKSELRQKGILQMFELVNKLKLANVDDCPHGFSLVECLELVQGVAPCVRLVVILTKKDSNRV